MSLDDGHPTTASPPPRKPNPTAAADVSFVKLNAEHHAESSSLAESRNSSEKGKNSTSEKLAKYKDKLANGNATPGGTSKRTSYHDGASRLPRKTGGFLLDSVFTNGKPNGDVHSPHRGSKSSSPSSHGPNHQRKSRMSDELSYSGSPLSHEVPASEDMRPNTAVQLSRPPTSMDPAQLVQMALSLSESRKRHVSSSLPLPVSPAGGRRVASALDSGYGTVRSGSSSAKRASMLSDGHQNSSPSSNRASQYEAEDNTQFHNGDNVVYTFSPATLSRAERARKYFELASEHRRLLENLPPLKTDATSPGNYTVQATSSPGSAHYHLERVLSNIQTKRQLGRSYNPLQALRNRRLRNRERRPLAAPPDTWQETDRIKNWIDGVEAAAKDPSFRPGDDQVRLPMFSGELEAETMRPETGKRHQRSDTVSSVITRPENGWSIEPAELLADTYWLEKDDNKTIIEDRNGQRIFQPRTRASLEVPRRSKESDRVDDNDSARSAHDSDHDGRVRHRRRNMLPIPGRLRRNRVNRSGSTSTVSSEEGRKPPQLHSDDPDGGGVNIGPLERHMRQMIAKDENGELSSPELVSPDHWESRHTPFPNARGGHGRHESKGSTAQSRLSVEMPGHRRSRSADGRVGSVDHGMASVDELMSESPNSPSRTGRTAHAAERPASSMDKQASSAEHKSRRSHIPIFRNRSRERNHIDRTDFATGVAKPAPSVIDVDSSSTRPRSSLDSSRPLAGKRHMTKESSTSGLSRTYTAATTATDASVKDSVGRRFLKGGRIGELVRNEGSRLGDRFRGSRDRGAEQAAASDVSRPHSDASDTDDFHDRRANGRTEDLDNQVSPRGSFEEERQGRKYYIQNLPSFKSPSARNRRSVAGTPMSEQSNPFDRPQRPESTQETSRNQDLPKISLPDEDSISDPDLSRSKSTNFLGFDLGRDRRKSASQNNLSLVPTNTTMLRPKRQDGLPMTGLAGHEARRHWSISDQAQPIQLHKVSARDVARIRALLLASGIKAHEIRHKADTPRDEPLPLITKIAATTGRSFDQVIRREENITAARALSETLSKSLSEFEQLLQHFRAETAKELTTRLDNLSHRASEQLTNIVYDTSDEADAFNVELTTKQPQEVKRVDDAVDAMFRQRRRQFRMVRRAGFKLLEWLVLGIMWWVWFVVVLFNSVKKGAVAIFKVVRWLLWF